MAIIENKIIMLRRTEISNSAQIYLDSIDISNIKLSNEEVSYFLVSIFGKSIMEKIEINIKNIIKTIDTTKETEKKILFQEITDDKLFQIEFYVKPDKSDKWQFCIHIYKWDSNNDWQKIQKNLSREQIRMTFNNTEVLFDSFDTKYFIKDKIVTISNSCGQSEARKILELIQDSYKSLDWELLKQNGLNVTEQQYSRSSATFKLEQYYINLDFNKKNLFIKIIEPFIRSYYIKKYNSDLNSFKNVNNLDSNNILDDVFLADTDIDNLINKLEENKNIIIKGQPGVGKTRNVKKILAANNFNIDYSIQFSVNTEYDDFIQGYRPGSNGFEIKNGIFMDCVDEALKNEHKKYAFIIDEINRGNVSSIFGELFTLMEKTKRNIKSGMKLAGRKEIFYVPNNIYIIGTMNTVDKQLFSLDFALQRRFEWISFHPMYNEKLINYVLKKDNNIQEYEIRSICEKLNILNAELTLLMDNDDSYQFGHSYLIKIIKNIQSNDSFKDKYNNMLEDVFRNLLTQYSYQSNLLDNNKIDELLENAKY